MGEDKPHQPDDVTDNVAGVAGVATSRQNIVVSDEKHNHIGSWSPGVPIVVDEVLSCTWDGESAHTLMVDPYVLVEVPLHPCRVGPDVGCEPSDMAVSKEQQSWSCRISASWSLMAGHCDLNHRMIYPKNGRFLSICTVQIII